MKPRAGHHPTNACSRHPFHSEDRETKADAQDQQPQPRDRDDQRYRPGDDEQDGEKQELDATVMDGGGRPSCF
jgi:hypothetical protein